eukprot:g16125.t1
MEVDQGKEQCVIVHAEKGSIINANYEILGFPYGTMVILRHKDDGKLLYKREELADDYFGVEATESGDHELCFINGKTDSIKRLKNQDVVSGARMVGLDALRQKKKQEMAKAQQDMIRDDDGFAYSNMLGMDDDWVYQGSESSIDDDSWYNKEPSRKTFGFGLRLGEDVEDIQAMSEVPQTDRNMASFLKEEADVLVRTLSFFNDHESYMRGREEFHRENVKQTSNRLMWCTFIEAAVLIWLSWYQLSYIRRFFETKRVL